jgi:hypothetical protein
MSIEQSWNDDKHVQTEETWGKKIYFSAISLTTNVM